MEESHYYPFGLTMAGISSKALSFGGPENKKKYQQYEFNSDFNINLYESFYRTHDPQIGRFLQIDPKPTDGESPYAAMGNNPVLNTDFLGDTLSPEFVQRIRSIDWFGGNKNGDQRGLVTNATQQEYDNNPIMAAGKDFSHAVFEFLGLNNIDEFVQNRREGNNSPLEIIYESALVVVSTASGGKSKGGGRQSALTGRYGDFVGSGIKDGHKIIQDAAVRDLPGYSKENNPAVQLDGPSTKVGSEHYNATQVQRGSTSRGTYAQERVVAYKALRGAGFSPELSKKLIHMADQYFKSIGVTGSTQTRIPGK
nr:RHS repeat-associated core domain-containing protein [Terrimonas ginsenosidimutans]